MSPAPETRDRTPLRGRRLTDALHTLGRPLLRISFFLYQVEVRRNLYPRDTLVTELEGIDPLRVLFAGDVAASGHGVLSHGLTVVTRTADALSAATGRGCSWRVIAETDLTMAGLAARPSLSAEGVELAFLLLGIPDVLLVTRSAAWARDLLAVTERIQRESGLRACRVIVSGIPPLSDFRPIRPAVRRVIDRQVDRLNAISVEVAERTPGLTFVPFPSWRIGEMYVKQMFSWKTMHETWAATLAEAARDR